MKKVITILGLFGLMLVQAQVGISTDIPNAGADLELGSSNKALLLNRVSSETDIATAVEGMIIFDATEHCFKGYQNGDWVEITRCTIPSSLSTLDCANTVLSSTPQANVAYTGTLSIPYTGGNGGVYEAQSISSTGVTGLIATIAAGTLANGAGNLEYRVSGTANSEGTASFAINIAGRNCTATINIAEALPPTITFNGSKYFIFSTYDTDYQPYSNPTGIATTATGVAADGISDYTIDIQGIISTAGINITIPATATSSGTLPAYSTTINIPANMTQDGVARDITLSWASQAFTATTKAINATIKALGGDLLAKKLDIQTGIGNDALGVLMGAFSIPSNSAGAMVNYEVRNIAGIPDRRFNETTNIGGVAKRYHDFIYLPVEVKGAHNVNGKPYKKIWLNMNLGAEYAKVSSDYFNPGMVKTGPAAHIDKKLYGSYLGWYEGRGACPDGYHTPTYTEFQNLHEAITGSRGSLTSSEFWNQSKLPNFAAAGYSHLDNGSVIVANSIGIYMSSEFISAASVRVLAFDRGESNPEGGNDGRDVGNSVRCIKD